MNRNRANFGFLVFISLTSCSGGGTTRGQQAYLDSLELPIQTQKEVAFIKDLSEQNYKDIFLDIPIIGVNCYGCSTYIIEAKTPFNLTQENQDSVAKINENIAVNLYTNIIEDSILNDLSNIQVVFLLKNKISKYSKGGDYRYRRVYDLDNLDSLTKR